MLANIGASKAVSSRGKSKERTIKKKPKCSFPVRKTGVKPLTVKRELSVKIA